MTGLRDFRIDIFDRFDRWVAPLGNFKELDATVRWRGISETSIVLPGTHHRLDAMTAEGAQLRVNFRRKTLMTGLIEQIGGVGPQSSGDHVFSCQSDARLLEDILGWPAPTKSLAQQGSDEDAKAYYTIGRQPLETIIKDVIRQNAARLGLRVVIAPDQRRGPITEVKFRMHALINRIQPALEASNLGITVEKRDGAFHIDVVEPQPYVQPLTEKSRVIQSWQLNRTAPTATRGVVGAQGQGTDRVFIPFQDAAREARWGRIIEVFKDARDTSETATHARRATEALEDTRARASLTVELTESGRFRILGDDGIQPGQLVEARVGRNTKITDVLSELNVSFKQETGVKITSTIGPRDNPDELIIKAITALAGAVADLKVST